MKTFWEFQSQSCCVVIEAMNSSRNVSGQSKSLRFADSVDYNTASTVDLESSDLERTCPETPDIPDVNERLGE